MEYKELVKYVAEAIRGNEEEIALSIKYIGMRYPFSDTVIADTVCDAIYEVGEGLIDVWSEYNKDEEEVFFDALDYLESEGYCKHKIADYRKLLNEVREEVSAKIIAILNEHKVETEYQEIGVYMTSTPILQEDTYDDNLTFTLDSIGVKQGELFFGGSSCDSNITVWASKMDIELLVGIYEWLVENEDEIFEYCD